jgi:hypothetical protein
MTHPPTRPPTPPPTHPPARPPLYVRRPFLAGVVRQIPLVLVLAVVVAGLGLVTLDRWRFGLVVIGTALLGAALMRLLLPVRRVGFLAVRSRPIDVVLMAGAGLALTVVALSVPG